jgi:hypothetical protein
MSTSWKMVIDIIKKPPVLTLLLLQNSEGREACFAVPPSFALLFSKKSLSRYMTWRDNGSTVRAYWVKKLVQRNNS